MDIPYAALMMFALAGLSVVLILIILLQRGRGGGLAGAFGGAGGQSALGTRAGDVFTKITIGLAVAWIVLACVNIYVLKGATERFDAGPGAGAATLSPAGGEAEDDTPVLDADEAAAAPAAADAELDSDAAFDEAFGGAGAAAGEDAAGDDAGPALPANE